VHALFAKEENYYSSCITGSIQHKQISEDEKRERRKRKTTCLPVKD